MRTADRIPIEPLARPRYPFERVNVDVIGPLQPPSGRGHKYALCIIDLCTQWPEVVCLRSLSARATCDALLRVFSSTGIPEVIASDCGTNFTAELTQEFLKRLGCSPRFSTPGHPESNGAVERWNRTFKNMLLNSLLKIDIDDPRNHAPLEKIDIGHAAEQVVKAAKLGAKDIFTFKMECKQFLISATNKILDKSPLRYPLVGAVSSLDPRQMCSKPDECLTGFRKVLDALIGANRLNEQQRDSVLAEYTELLQEEKHSLRLFERHSNDLGAFFFFFAIF